MLVFGSIFLFDFSSCCCLLCIGFRLTSHLLSWLLAAVFCYTPISILCNDLVCKSCFSPEILSECLFTNPHIVIASCLSSLKKLGFRLFFFYLLCLIKGFESPAFLALVATEATVTTALHMLCSLVLKCSNMTALNFIRISCTQFTNTTNVECLGLGLWSMLRKCEIPSTHNRPSGSLTEI